MLVLVPGSGKAGNLMMPLASCNDYKPASAPNAETVVAPDVAAVRLAGRRAAAAEVRRVGLRLAGVAAVRRLRPEAAKGAPRRNDEEGRQEQGPPRHCCPNF